MFLLIVTVLPGTAIEAFGLFPFPFFFNSFCLDRRTFLVFSNTRSFMILAE